MSTRLLLEGPDIGTLLARVRDEHGGAARIVSADKVRTGGIAGFFARQRYELTLEVIDGAEDQVATATGSVEPAGTGLAAAEPAGTELAAAEPGTEPAAVEPATAAFGAADHLLENEPADQPMDPASALVAMMDAAETQLDARPGAPRVTAPVPAAPAVAAPVVAAPAVAAPVVAAPAVAAPVVAAPAVAAPVVVAPAVAAPVTAWVPPAPAAGPMPTPDIVPPVAPVLAWTPTALAPAVLEPIVFAPAAPTPAAPAPAALAPAATTSAAPTPSAPAPVVPETSAASFQTLLADLRSERRRPEPTAGAHHARHADPAPGSPAGAADPLAGAAGPRANGHAELSAGELLRSPTGRHRREPAEPVAPPMTTPADALLTAGLVALGVPETIACQAYGPDRYSAVARAFGSLPRPPAVPALPGDTLVLAGDLVIGLRLARDLALVLRIDPERILVASPVPVSGVDESSRLSGPADALRQAGRLRAANAPNLVVVDAPMDATAGPWARSVTDALCPTAVWAVVDATRKTADTAAHLDRFGPVNALAVHGTADTADPACVLRLGPPVAYLDREPAHVTTWAGLLSARLSDVHNDDGRGGRHARHAG